jgi:hypothetical protein
VAIAAFGLAACEPASGAAPEFWSLAVHQDGAADRMLVICADDPVLQAFMRSLPEVNGTPCALADSQLLRMEFCTSGNDRYTIQSSLSGVDDGDVTVVTVIAGGEGAGRRFERRMHFRRRARRCPDAWSVGEAGVQGGRQVMNVVSGKTRVLPRALPVF